MVCVRTGSGVLLPCAAAPEPDGALWCCALCGQACIRCSFGVMQGLWRCQCGAEIQFLVDGRWIDPRQIEPLEPIAADKRKTAEAEKPKRTRKKRIKSDKDFLTQCGIAPLTEGEKP
jgi:hypothetical protein